MERVVRNTSNWAAGINLVLGVWLFISAFVWPHTMGQQTNTWILGVLIALASAWAMYAPNARYLDTIFAVWLFVSTLVIARHSPATMWNNLIVAIIVFVLSLPGGVEPVTGRRPVHA
jgi:uncharacterized membrane protein